jgi:hypothetical protein
MLAQVKGDSIEGGETRNAPNRSTRVRELSSWSCGAGLSDWLAVALWCLSATAGQPAQQGSPAVDEQLRGVVRAHYIT